MSLPNNWTLEEVLSLTYCKKVTLQNIKDSVEKFSSANELQNPASENILSKLFSNNELFDNQRFNAIDEAKNQIELCHKLGVNIVSIWDDEYPDLLKEIPFPPNILFVKGKLQKSDSVSISIVGTRMLTIYGRITAENFSAFFAKNGIIVTSGLANGIDTVAHLSTIKSGGTTYAILGSGIDKMTSFAEKNAANIVETGGAIISEYQCGTTAKPAYFPQRNRIISGISKALLVIESDIKGGSMITVKFALDQNREVFAVPGDIRSSKSKGCNFLIKKNMATAALSPENIMDDLGYSIIFDQKSNERKINLDPIEQRIFDIINYEPLHIDEISHNLELEITDVMVKLLNMEFNGIVRQLPGKHYIKAV